MKKVGIFLIFFVLICGSLNAKSTKHSTVNSKKTTNKVIYGQSCSLTTPIMTHLYNDDKLFLVIDWGGQRILFNAYFTTADFSNLVATILLVNNTSQTIDFKPEEIKLIGYKKITGSDEVKETDIKVYSAIEYAKVLKQRGNGALFLMSMANGMNQGMMRRNTYANVSGTDQYGHQVQGTVTIPPNYANAALVNQISNMQIQQYQDQAQIENNNTLSGYLKSHTLFPLGYYGGDIYALKNKKYDRYEMTVPFGGCEFKFQFVINKNKQMDFVPAQEGQKI